MSIRTEVMADLLNAGPIIPIRRREIPGLVRDVDQKRNGYEEARKTSLAYLLATHYRVVIFGSARLDDDSPEFKAVTDLSRALVEAYDVDIVTGGGPGIMRAAHLGTHQAIEEANVKGTIKRARNHGVGITLPFQEPSNGLAEITSTHPEFSTRLQEFIDKTHASYTAPGGIGTLLELAMLVQSRQVGHLESGYPIIAHPHWKPVADAWNDALYHNREQTGKKALINADDLELIKFSDKTHEIVDAIGVSYRWWRTNIKDKVRSVKQ